MWRKWLRIFHRDIGYVAVALIIAYGVSGLAVNHIEDWNPSYTFAERGFDIGPLPAGDPAALADAAITRLRLDRASVRGHFLETATTCGCSCPTARRRRSTSPPAAAG